MGSSSGAHLGPGAHARRTLQSPPKKGRGWWARNEETTDAAYTVPASVPDDLISTADGEKREIGNYVVEVHKNGLQAEAYYVRGLHGMPFAQLRKVHFKPWWQLPAAAPVRFPLLRPCKL